MSKKKKIDNRKQLLVRYLIAEDCKVRFIDPCCDEIPAILLGKVMEALSEVEHEWNNRMANEATNA